MTMTQSETTGRSGWVTLAVLSCLGLVTIFGETMVLPAIPDFIRDFRISYDTSSWILSAYLIAGAVMTPVAGKLSDLYGKKRILLAVMAVYCAGVLAGGFANSIGFMIAARATMGVGISMFPIAFGIIRESLPERKLAIGQTIFSSTFSGGAVVGLVVGASIIKAYGWHFTFFSVFPFAAILALVIWKLVGPAAPQDPSGGMVPAPGAAPGISIDYKGILLLAATVVPFLAGVTQLQSTATDPSMAFQVGGLFATSAGALVLLVLVERRASLPLIDLKLLTNRTLLPATIILMVVGLCTFMVYQTVPILVRSPQPLGFGGDALTIANVQLPFVLVLLVGTVSTGFILNRVGNVRMTAIGTGVSAVGFFSLLAFHSTELMVTLTLAVIAAGLSFSFTGGFNVVLMSAPMQSTGIALGMTLLLNLVGQSIGPAVASAFQQTYQGSVAGVAGTFPLQEAYYLIFLTAAVLSLISVVLSLSLARRRQPIWHAPYGQASPVAE